jgi:luciferase family oxidoreductase group 1
MLEAFHPGRIDLGLGRAPGTDPATAAALRRGAGQPGVEDDFPRQLGDLLAYFEGSHPAITAVPAAGYRPELWLLGSSDYSAQAAAILGLPFSFAHHFASANTNQAIEVYRRSFRPSSFLEQPYVMIGVGVICAPDAEEAAYLAGPSAISFLSLRQGRPRQMPTPEEAARHEFTPIDRQLIAQWQAPLVVGDPVTVGNELTALAERFGLDELMVTTMVHGHEHRLRSYELLAEVWDLPSAP